MAGISEEKIIKWSKPPSESEEERCSNTIGMIKDALNNHPGLKEKETEIILQGSFKNNTNIRIDSDIDICIRLMDTFFFKLPDGYSKEEYMITPAEYTYAQFNNAVNEALIEKFGSINVHKKNKAYAIDSNSYRVKADVIAAFEHRRYTDPPKPVGNKYLSGIEFITNNGNHIINWPQQHHENGVEKNKKTNRKYKRCVRIIKNLRNKMGDEGISSAGRVPSYLIECLCWNVPDEEYTPDVYLEFITGVLLFLYKNTKISEPSNDWVEVSEKYYLFGGKKPWTREQANQFTYDAWNYIK